MSEKAKTTERHHLAVSSNGKPVWYDPKDSHTATHIKDAPQLVELAAEITKITDLHDEFTMFHTDMGHTIGTSDLVAIETGDRLVWAKRANRDTYTVFNMSKQSQPSSLVTTAYEQHNDGTYELVSTWIGPSDSPSMPGTERETPDSRAFWSTHALAWGTQEIQPGTETTSNPW